MTVLRELPEKPINEEIVRRLNAFIFKIMPDELSYKLSNPTDNPVPGLFRFKEEFRPLSIKDVANFYHEITFERSGERFVFNNKGDVMTLREFVIRYIYGEIWKIDNSYR